MSTTVYLADLRYSSDVLANDAMPLGVSYMKAVMDRDLPEVRSRVFAYPDRLLAALRSEPPDVMMFSNYGWNESLGQHFAKIGKQIRPDMLVIMGGPNISLEPERQIAYFSRLPQLDVYVLGEGDFLATEMVRRFLNAGKSVKKMGEGDLPSCLYRRPGGEVVRQPVWDRHNELEDIPSPWLTGVQDGFFDGKLAPMIETNRGCPFCCTFCVEGTGYHTKVHNFPIERVREEIMYIGRRITQLSPQMRVLYITDSNYGMFERDIEISGYLGEAQKLFGWPTFIDATTGKNRPERIIKSLEQTGGALVLYQAVQSFDENVLRNVKRQNIKLEAYEQLHVHLRGRGMRSGSDLILGLPGESLPSHLAGMEKLIDTGVTQMHNFQAMMLKGSEMETQQSRDMFQFKTAFRLLPKNFDVFEGNQVMETEEIVVSTATLPFADYITARKHHLACSILWNDGCFEQPVAYAARFGVKRSEWLHAMLPAMEQEAGAVRKLLEDFVYETEHELFPTREACVAHYCQPENFKRLHRGEIGDNLMYKYRALASYYIWPELSAMAMKATKELLVQRGARESTPNFDAFWADFARYTELKHAHGRNAEQILTPVTDEIGYDLPQWVESGMPQDPSPYRLPRPDTFEFRLSDEGATELQKALAVWPTTTKGLSKVVVRLRPAWQVRGCRPLCGPTAPLRTRREASPSPVAQLSFRPDPA
jgi:radical SAM superfamily enzyme YgiQ (UPF0313 family)